MSVTGCGSKTQRRPRASVFHGLHWYPPKRRVPRACQVGSVQTLRRCSISPPFWERSASFPPRGPPSLRVDGHVVRLEPVLEDPQSTELFFIMRDTTSKTTTYGAGRFLYTELPDHGLTQPGEVWLDFNQLVNPPCAFTPYATCPTAADTESSERRHFPPESSDTTTSVPPRWAKQIPVPLQLCRSFS